MTKETLGDNILKEFKASHSFGGFPCRYDDCVRATTGFRSEELRRTHEASHAPAFRCMEPVCAFPGSPFKSRSALNNHISKYHDKSAVASIPNSLPARSPQFEHETPLHQLGASGIQPAAGEHEPAEATTPAMDQATQSLADLKLGDLDVYHKQEQDDWHVIYNPTIQRDISIRRRLTTRMDGPIDCICFAPDSETLAIACPTELRILDTESGTVEDYITKNDGLVYDLSYSPCGNFLASGGGNGFLIVSIHWK